MVGACSRRPWPPANVKGRAVSAFFAYTVYNMPADGEANMGLSEREDES